MPAAVAAEASKSSPTNRMTAQARYEQLKEQREPYLERARECAELTIPALVPPEGAGNADLYSPFQSIGARGVNHLSAKLLLALFPPNSPFFRLSVDESILDELSEQAGPESDDIRGEIEKALSRVERTVLARMEQKGARTTLAETLKNLIVAGNCLVQVLDDGGLRLHPLSHFVVKRDKAGMVLEIIAMETVSRLALPEEALAIVAAREEELDESDESTKDTINLYTRVRRTRNKWIVHQEVVETVIPDTEGTYPIDKSPWLPLRMIKVDGQDYGRSVAEEYLGDLRSLEVLTQAIVESAAAAAKILIFVEEGGLTSMQEVAESASGSVLPGSADDITVFQLEKFADMAVAKQTHDEIKSRLEQAFLLLSGVQRNAERVTAQEIRALVNELEQSLGGIYSVLAQELQAPLVRRVMHQLQNSNDLPRLPDDAVRPEIVTGVEALGRTSDLQKLDIFLAGVQEISGPEALMDYLNLGSYMTRRATALGIDLEGLIRSEKEVESIRQERMQQQMIEKLGPQAVQARTKQNAQTQEES